MENSKEVKTPTVLTVSTTVSAPIEKVWKYWNEPEHIKQWAFASDDWHAPESSNDLRVGGKLSTTMAAKDGSMSFEFWSIYSKVEPFGAIDYELGDGRKVEIRFTEVEGGTKIVQSFEAEETNSLEMQQGGWQAIIDNFKKHVEND